MKLVKYFNYGFENGRYKRYDDECYINPDYIVRVYVNKEDKMITICLQAGNTITTSIDVLDELLKN